MQKIEALFKEYFLRLHHFAISWVNSDDVANDIVQDAYVNLVENKDVLDKPNIVIKTYLYSTVKNLCLNYIRANKIRLKYNELSKAEEADNTDHLDRLIKSEIIGELHAELSKLPEGCQHICRLIYIENKKYQEVAEELNISINTVKTQRQRALNLLKSRMIHTLLLIFGA